MSGPCEETMIYINAEAMCVGTLSPLHHTGTYMDNIFNIREPFPSPILCSSEVS